MDCWTPLTCILKVVNEIHDPKNSIPEALQQGDGKANIGGRFGLSSTFT